MPLAPTSLAPLRSGPNCHLWLTGIILQRYRFRVSRIEHLGVEAHASCFLGTEPNLSFRVDAERAVALRAGEYAGLSIDVGQA